MGHGPMVLMVGEVGVEPTLFTAKGLDLQSRDAHAIASTHPILLFTLELPPGIEPELRRPQRRVLTDYTKAA